MYGNIEDLTVRVYPSNIEIFDKGERIEIVYWDNICPEKEIDSVFTDASEYITDCSRYYDGILSQGDYSLILRRWKEKIQNVLDSFQSNSES